MFDQFVGTKPVEERHRLDNARLDAYMRANVEGYSGTLEVAQFKGGQSNPTYRLSAGGRNYVLRKKPPGKLLPSAHAVDREFKVIKALHGAGFPVPRPYALCEDDGVIGTMFFIMDCVEGRVLWDQALPGMTKTQRFEIWEELNRVIAQLHTIDYKAVGLETFGKPGSYLERQIGRWTKQYQASETQKIEAMDNLIEWLPKNIPAGDETTVVHGDFRLDNTIFHPTEPRILAVLDWELSTLGHPLADFSYHAMMYHMPPDIVAGLGGADPVALGLPTEADYIAAYCKRRGLPGIDNWNFYMAFSFFRLAAIFHGIKGRVLRGNAASATATERAAAFPRLAQLAREAMERCQ